MIDISLVRVDRHTSPMRSTVFFKEITSKTIYYVTDLMSLQRICSSVVCIDQHIKQPSKLYSLEG